MKIFLLTLLLLLINACKTPHYYQTIEKEGNLTVIDYDKANEFLLNYNKNYGNPLPPFDDVFKENYKPEIGVIIKHEGKIRPGGIINLVVYPVHNTTKKYYDTILPWQVVSKDKVYYLITNDILKKLNILDNTDRVTDGLVIESTDRDNKKIPMSKYIIKLTKNEINEALDKLYEQYPYVRE